MNRTSDFVESNYPSTFSSHTATAYSRRMQETAKARREEKQQANAENVSVQYWDEKADGYKVLEVPTYRSDSIGEPFTLSVA